MQLLRDRKGVRGGLPTQDIQRECGNPLSLLCPLPPGSDSSFGAHGLVPGSAGSKCRRYSPVPFHSVPSIGGFSAFSGKKLLDLPREMGPRGAIACSPPGPSPLQNPLQTLLAPGEIHQTLLQGPVLAALWVSGNALLRGTELQVHRQAQVTSLWGLHAEWQMVAGRDSRLGTPFRRLVAHSQPELMRCVAGASPISLVRHTVFLIFPAKRELFEDSRGLAEEIKVR